MSAGDDGRDEGELSLTRQLPPRSSLPSPSLSRTLALSRKLGFRGWGLRAAEDERGRKEGEVGRDSGSESQEIRPPFVTFISFSFILLLQLVFLIYSFKPYYPKINGNL